MWGLPQKQNARRADKIRLCGHLRRYKKIVKKTYIISSNFFVKIRYVEIILKTFIEYKSISIIGSEIMNKNEYRHQLFEEYISLVLLHISLTFFSFL